MSKVVFFGASKYVVPILQVLDPVLIVTTERHETEPVSNYAKENNIPLLSITSLNNPAVQQKIKHAKTDIAVLAYFGLILPQSVLDIFPKGIINTHPSLLPKYRGPTPGQAAILSGDTETGVSIIKLDAAVDHGPILIQHKTPLYPTESADMLYGRLFSDGAGLLAANLPIYYQGKLQLEEQDHTRATFTPELTRDSGYIDVQNPPPPAKLDRMIRAYYPWPGVWGKIKIKNRELRIKLLPEKKLQVEGKKPMSLKDFYNGYPESETKIVKLLYG